MAPVRPAPAGLPGPGRLVAMWDVCTVTEDIGYLRGTCPAFRRAQAKFGKGYVMCDHIKNIIRTHGDAPSHIFPEVEAGDAAERADDIVVPIWPDSDVWAEVTVDGEGGASILGADFYEADSTMDLFLGFVTEREGRRALRALVVAWLADLDVGWWRCHSPAHETVGWPEDRSVEQTTYLEPAQANIWSCLTKGFCLPCLDAIPEGRPTLTGRYTF